MSKKKMVSLDGSEMAHAVKEYLQKRGHRVRVVNFFAEEAEANEGQPTFWCIVETVER